MPLNDMEVRLPIHPEPTLQEGPVHYKIRLAEENGLTPDDVERLGYTESTLLKGVVQILREQIEEDMEEGGYYIQDLGMEARHQGRGQAEHRHGDHASRHAH